MAFRRAYHLDSTKKVWIVRRSSFEFLGKSSQTKAESSIFKLAKVYQHNFRSGRFGTEKFQILLKWINGDDGEEKVSQYPFEPSSNTPCRQTLVGEGN